MTAASATTPQVKFVATLTVLVGVGLIAGSTSPLALVGCVLAGVGLLAGSWWSSFVAIGLGQAALLVAAVMVGLPGGSANAVRAALIAAVAFLAGEAARLVVQLRRFPAPPEIGSAPLRLSVTSSVVVGVGAALVGLFCATAAGALLGSSRLTIWLWPVGLVALPAFVLSLRGVVRLPRRR